MCVLTDGDGGFSSQQQLETLAVVGQAAVMQRRASSGRLLVQVGAETHTQVMGGSMATVVSDVR